MPSMAFSTGFVRELDIVGIGYRADVKGEVVSFTLGYSHPIEFVLPKGVECKIDKQDAPGIEQLRQAVAGSGGCEHEGAAQAGSLQK